MGLLYISPSFASHCRGCFARAFFAPVSRFAICYIVDRQDLRAKYQALQYARVARRDTVTHSVSEEVDNSS